MGRSRRLPSDPEAEFSYLLDRRGVDKMARSMNLYKSEVQEIAEGKREIPASSRFQLHRSFVGFTSNPMAAPPAESRVVRQMFRSGQSKLLGGDPRVKAQGSQRISGTSPSPEYVENYLGRSNLYDPDDGPNPIAYVTVDEEGDIEIWIADETP